MPTRCVAVTGATGFIGGAIARSLLDSGWRVRVLVRASSTEKPLPGGVEQIVGSLDDLDKLEDLLEGADAVVHCAAVVRGAAESTFMRTNTDAVESLVRLAAEKTSVERFLLLSSLAASRPEVSPYAASKRAAERKLETAGGAMVRLALRPPAVYGPGDRELLPLFKAMARGVAPAWGDRKARFSLIFVTDLVAAVTQWLSSRTPAGGVFELHDGRVDGYSMDEVIEIAAAVLQRRIRRISVPAKVLDLTANINVRLARVARYEPMLTPWKLRELRHPRWVCDNSAFTAVSGWEPRILLPEGLSLALAGNRT